MSATIEFGSKEDIFELIDKFDKSSLSALEVSVTSPAEREVTVKMSKTAGVRNNDENLRGETDMGGESFSVAGNERNDMALKAAEETESTGNDRVVRAPFIGTFYSSPSPDSEPYVKEGDKITKGTVLCIIEAMKIMNDIESETDGEIAEILVRNADSVEYGQPLFRLK